MLESVKMSSNRKQNGHQSLSVEHHQPLESRIYGNLLWYIIMVYYGILLWYIMVYYGILLYIIVIYYGILL